ncbi:hypothetical protein C5468_25060 [Photorhabdus luminescens subsp. mexicana]|uniref:Uncharacterized protein n=1 Tax=Photorhabdus luminescens subsp. mexicana TaxID=2100167 RepID=A0A4R4IQW2_PHOLU|nr:hypothetical protein C5468_25060 [Photorhabdus luminescens subsp. mexicana]
MVMIIRKTKAIIIAYSIIFTVDMKRMEVFIISSENKLQQKMEYPQDISLLIRKLRQIMGLIPRIAAFTVYTGIIVLL